MWLACDHRRARRQGTALTEAWSADVGRRMQGQRGALVQLQVDAQQEDLGDEEVRQDEGRPKGADAQGYVCQMVP